MIKIDDIPIVPTIFPDKTSQIWKLPESLLAKIEKENMCNILWEFENDDEIMHLAQLKTLLDLYCDFVALVIPYLPYGRQDKHVSNTSTFALKTFAKIINSLGFSRVITLDAHNNMKAHMIENFEDLSPRDYIRTALTQSGADLLLFSDAGAKTRYEALNIARSVWADKVRDQLTGNITDIIIHGAVKGRKLLIVDDICDGGATFKIVAEKVLKTGAKEVNLYVTHGIFSKGVKTLLDSGINRIFTHKGEVDIPVIGGHRQPLMFSVEPKKEKI